jgi:hypothetical protein
MNYSSFLIYEVRALDPPPPPLKRGEPISLSRSPPAPLKKGGANFSFKVPLFKGDLGGSQL